MKTMNMKSKRIWAMSAAAVAVCTLGVSLVRAGTAVTPEGTMFYSGELLQDGIPVDGPQDISVSFYATSTSTAPLCTKSAPKQPVHHGRFRVELPKACGEKVLGNPNVFVAVDVGTTRVGTPVQVGAVPYALASKSADVANHADTAGFANRAAAADSANRATRADVAASVQANAVKIDDRGLSGKLNLYRVADHTGASEVFCEGQDVVISGGGRCKKYQDGGDRLVLESSPVPNREGWRMECMNDDNFNEVNAPESIYAICLRSQ